jgi:hypothetical protein
MLGHDLGCCLGGCGWLKYLSKFHSVEDAASVATYFHDAEIESRRICIGAFYEAPTCPPSSSLDDMFSL